MTDDHASATPSPVRWSSKLLVVRPFRPLLKRVLLIAGVMTLAMVVVSAAVVWAFAHDEVAHLRKARAKSAPLAPTVQAAMLAAEPSLLQPPPRFSLLSILRTLPTQQGCGPTLALRLARNSSQRERMLRRHIETAIVATVITFMWTPEDLLRIYAHEAYLGKVNDAQVFGFEAASRAYFHKTPRDLTPAQAALLVGILPYPNAWSPTKHPARAIERRNRVLAEMHRRGDLDELQWRSGMLEPLPAPGA